jgi:hypothetical protein
MFYYSAGRPSVIWDVSGAAKQTEASERLATLAQHKKGHPEFTPDRFVSVFHWLCINLKYMYSTNSSSNDVDHGNKYCLVVGV